MTTKIRYTVRNAADYSDTGFGWAVLREEADALYIMHEGKKTRVFFDGYVWYIFA